MAEGTDIVWATQKCKACEEIVFFFLLDAPKYDSEEEIQKARLFMYGCVIHI